MKHTKIQINNNTIIGSEIKSTVIINLTSLSIGPLRAILMRIPTLPQSDKLKFRTLTNNIIYDSDTLKPITGRRKKVPVTIITDEDDKKKNAKIRNLMRISRMYMVTNINIKNDIKNKNINDVSKTGRIMRYSHFGHTKEVKAVTDSMSLTVNNSSSLARATIIETNDDRCGSTDAIKMYLDMIKVPYSIEKHQVSYTESWLTTNRKIVKMKTRDTNIAADIIPDNDKDWMSKTGYGDYLMTNQGPKVIEIGDVKQKKGMYSKAVKLVKSLIIWFGRVWKDIKRWFNNEDKDTNNMKPQTASLTVEVPTGVLSHLASIYVAALPQNASKDIKAANKLVTKMQLNKILSRVGVGGDKTILAKKTSDSFDAYMSGITSYNTGEAIINANNLASSSYKSKRNITIALMMLCIVIFCLIKARPMMIIVSFSICALDYFLQIFEGNKIFYTINIMLSNSLLSLVLNCIIMVTEYVIKDDKTAVLRSVGYLLITCLSWLV